MNVRYVRNGQPRTYLSTTRREIEPTMFEPDRGFRAGSMIWVYINYEGVGTFNDLGLHKL
jgi:hypothetical protein